MSKQEFRTADLVRLEVQADDIATTNLVKNGIPDLGTYLWRTPDVNSVLEARFDQPVLPKFRLSAGVTGNVYAQYAPIPVTAGQYVAARAAFVGRPTSNETATVTLFWVSGGLVTAASATWSGGVPATSTAPAQVPAGVSYAVVRVVANTSGGNLAAGRYVEFTQVAVRQAATSAAVASLDYSEPYEWTNVLGKAHTISATHDGIGVGLLSATVYDSTLDPAVSSALRPGRLVRLTAQDPGYSGLWNSIWRGTIRTASADYDLSQVVVDRRARIVITAANAVAQASNTGRSAGVGTIAELAYLFELAALPWAVNGSGTQPFGSPTYLTDDPKKSLLDQVAVTRDSVRGYAWVDRRGVLNVSDAASRPTALAATLTEADYTALAVDYDTDRCINNLTVKALRYVEDQTAEVVFGPYRDEASIAQWGAHSTEVTVQGLDDTQVASYAAAVLAANSTPVRKVNSLRFAVRTAADLTTATGTRRALLDTYDNVRVTNAVGTIDQTLRPTTITHTLTAGPTTDKWTVDLAFAADAAAAAPISVPAPPGPSITGGSAAATGTQAANVVTTTNGSGIAVITFPRAYPTGTVPVVVCTGGNQEALSIDPANLPTATGFRVLAKNGAGSAITSSPIRVLYIATPATT